VRAVASATISSRTLATVTAVKVRAGDRIAAGDVLVQLDDRDLLAQQRRTEQATVAVQRAHAAALADRDAAAAALGLARAANDRIITLVARESATTQERDEALAALRGAESHAAAADARIAQLAAEVSASQQAATASEVAASFAVIRAPFAGIVVERLIDPGDLVSPGVPLLRLDGTDAFRLEVSVDDARVRSISLDSRVEVWIDDAPQATEGRVSEIARSTGTGAHAFLVKIDLPRASTGESRWRSGMFGRARFAAAPARGLAMPREALVQQGQLATAWVVVDGRARRRVIALGEATGGDALAVAAGLVEGDQVVVSPPPRLRDGDAVGVAGAR